MKKLPEEDLWNGMKSRLGDYSEDPDEETWDRISGALPKKSPSLGVSRKLMIACALLLMVGPVAWWAYEFNAEQTRETPSAEATRALPKTEDPVESYTQQDTSVDEQSGTMTGGNEDESGSMNKITQSIDKRSESIDAVSRSSPASSTVKAFENSHNHSQVEVGTNAVPLANNVVSAEIGNRFNADGSLRRKGNNSPAPPNQKKASVAGDFIDEDEPDTPADQIVEPVSENSQRAIGQQTNNLTDDENVNVTVDASLLTGEFTRVQDQNTHTDKRNRAPGSSQIPNVDDEHELVGDSITIESKEETNRTVQKEGAAKTRRINRFKFYVALTPSLAFAIVDPVPNDDVNVVGLHSPGIFDKDRMGLSVDAGVERALSERLEWYAGLSFYKQNQRIAYVYETSGFILITDGSGSYSIAPATGMREFEYKMINAGLSTGLFYRIMGAKLKHKAGIGIQFQQGMLKTPSEMAYDNSGSKYFNYQLSYRIQIPVEGNYSLYLQPTFIHAIIAQETLSEPFKVRPYRAGITLGILFSNLSRSVR